MAAAPLPRLARSRALSSRQIWCSLGRSRRPAAVLHKVGNGPHHSRLPGRCDEHTPMPQVGVVHDLHSMRSKACTACAARSAQAARGAGAARRVAARLPGAAPAGKARRASEPGPSPASTPLPAPHSQHPTARRQARLPARTRTLAGCALRRSCSITSSAGTRSSPPLSMTTARSGRSWG